MGAQAIAIEYQRPAETMGQPHWISRLPFGLGNLSARRAPTRTEAAAFEALLEPCWDALWRCAYRTAGNTEEAGDLLSETVVEGFRSFRQYRAETTFVRWMYRIMFTTWIDTKRRAQRRAAQSLDALIESGSQTEGWLLDAEADPAVALIESALSEPVQRALNALPEEFRKVVVLADMEQMDYADVSSTLNIPIGTVRSRLHRARALLRRALAEYVRAEP
jgi:RNA polymerase sigma-70 factor (ECF subfamily)